MYLLGVRKHLEDAIKEDLKLLTINNRCENYHILISSNLKKIYGYVGTGEFRSPPENPKFEPDVESVWYSAALNGYGPLIYDLAMSETTVKGKWLAPDINCSPSARKLWNHYHTNRQHELSIKGLQARQDWLVDGFVAFNYSYKLQIPLDASTLKFGHGSYEVTKMLKRVQRFFFAEFYKPQ